MTTIVALSGKKQAGKTTLAEYLRVMIELRNASMDYDNVSQASNGDVMINAFGIDADSKQFIEVLRNNGKQTVKIYSFADALKEICVDVLGLKPEQVWGTDAQKNSMTDIKWETMPEFIRWNNSSDKTFRCPSNDTLIPNYSTKSTEASYMAQRQNGYIPKSLRSGTMTAREVMQVFGTDIMRNMLSDVIWVNATFRRIHRDNPKVALITDLRFPSEMNALDQNGGYIIRLDRQITSGDLHPSEVSLDSWDWNGTKRCLRIPDCDIPTRNHMSLEWVFKEVLK